MVSINLDGKTDVILIIGQCLPSFMLLFTKVTETSSNQHPDVILQCGDWSSRFLIL